MRFYQFFITQKIWNTQFGEISQFLFIKKTIRELPNVCNDRRVR
jgi:hypothetical protein